jgi:hypothetical protein
MILSPNDRPESSKQNVFEGHAQQFLMLVPSPQHQRFPFQGSPSSLILTLNTSALMPSVAAEHTRTGGRLRRMNLPMDSSAFVALPSCPAPIATSTPSGVHRMFSSSPLFISAFEAVGILGLQSYRISVQHRGPRMGSLLKQTT